MPAELEGRGSSGAAAGRAPGSTIRNRLPSRNTAAGRSAWPARSKSPLTFQASSPVTLLEAITRAGGLTAEAGSEILISTRQAGPNGEPTSLTQRVAVKALIDSADPDAEHQAAGRRGNPHSRGRQGLRCREREAAGSFRGSGRRRDQRHEGSGAGGRAGALRRKAGIYLPQGSGRFEK